MAGAVTRDDHVERAVAELMKVAERITAAGIISASMHGNISVRIADSTDFMFSVSDSLLSIARREVVRVTTAGRVVEGDVSEYAGVSIGWHAAIYRERPDTGCTIHTHAPHTTAFAVARLPIRPVNEAFRLYGFADGVPVARYAKRESPALVQNLARAIAGVRTQAVLMPNHGFICFNRTPDLAILTSMIVEEAAELCLLASGLGGAKLIPSLRSRRRQPQAGPPPS
jgi:ribulose-5-phosphate 4-epimerase/fuculose-1-phosphate aldolase